MSSILDILNNNSTSNDYYDAPSDAEILTAALSSSLPWSTYEDILKGEANPKTAHYRLNYVFKWAAFTDKIWRDVPGHRSGYVYVCPELTYLWPMIRKETNQDVAVETIRSFLMNPKNIKYATPGVRPDVSKVVAVDTELIDDNVWFSTTIKGVNLRPGIMGLPDDDGHDIEKTEPLHLDDMNPHGLIAGRTGAGKSVALNAMIASLMTEFPPWELNINLADFKIVEMSRYGQTGFEAPHVSKIAATEAMEYVVSVMYDMYEAMSVRQMFFAAVGVQNIKDFREKFGVVLPHVVLLVDEFQQMYELASNKQTDIINALIKMVTKLGRATGYHLLFASQSMSGTLSADVQSNFKLRVCLPASEDVSTAVLGNKASSELRGKGYCWTNCEGGAIDANIKYRVPFLRSETENPNDLTELQKILKWNRELADKIGYSHPQNFFRDSAIRPMRGTGLAVRTFEEDIQLFRQGTYSTIENDMELEDILLLGDSYVYKVPVGKDMDVTLEYFNLKIGDRKNIICIGDTPYDRAYLFELLAMQYAAKGETNRNVIVNADPIMSELVSYNDILTSGGSPASRDVLGKDFIANFIKDYSTRNIINDFVQYRLSIEKASETNGTAIVEEDLDYKLLSLISASKLDPDNFIEGGDPDDMTHSKIKTDEFISRYRNYMITGTMPDEYTNLSDAEESMVFSSLAKDATEDDKNIAIKDMIECKNIIRNQYIEIISSVFNAIKRMYISGVKNGKFSFKNMQTLTYWVIGYNGISSIAGERNQSSKIDALMRNCTNLGMRCIFIGGAVRDISELLRNFGYVLIKSTTENNYSKFDMTMSKEFKDNVIRFKAIGEVVNNVKQHLYPVPPDEKMFKKYDADYAEFGENNYFSFF